MHVAPSKQGVSRAQQSIGRQLQPFGQVPAGHLEEQRKTFCFTCLRNMEISTCDKLLTSLHSVQDSFSILKLMNFKLIYFILNNCYSCVIKQIRNRKQLYNIKHYIRANLILLAYNLIWENSCSVLFMGAIWDYFLSRNFLNHHRFILSLNMEYS